MRVWGEYNYIMTEQEIKKFKEYLFSPKFVENLKGKTGLLNAIVITYNATGYAKQPSGIRQAMVTRRWMEVVNKSGPYQKEYWDKHAGKTSNVFPE